GAAAIGYLLNPDNAAITRLLETMEPAAAALNLRLQQFPVRGPREFEGAFMTMARSGIDLLQVQEDSMLTSNAMPIAELALRDRFPSVGGGELAEGGGLIGYGAKTPELSRRAATFVDKILKGAKPADLPVEQPTRFEVILNRKTANALGIDFPLTVLVRADEVIE